MLAGEAFGQNWRLYIFEALELAIFMLSACAGTVFAVRYIPDAGVQRAVLGMAMGATAILIIHSPMGKSSGAHFNPAITLTYLRLGKIAPWDAAFYIVFQFCGAIFGVGVSALLLGKAIAGPRVNYAVTVPGRCGPAAAFAAELFMALLLMAVVLWSSNRPALAKNTAYFVGVLIALYVLFFAPVSGFSINPARTVGSAVFAEVWNFWWIYFTAPLLGMLASAEFWLRAFGAESILCAKLHPDPAYPCPFRCHYPHHRHQH